MFTRQSVGRRRRGATSDFQRDINLIVWLNAMTTFGMGVMFAMGIAVGKSL